MQIVLRAKHDCAANYLVNEEENVRYQKKEESGEEFTQKDGCSGNGLRQQWHDSTRFEFARNAVHSNYQREKEKP